MEKKKTILFSFNNSLILVFIVPYNAECTCKNYTEIQESIK